MIRSSSYGNRDGEECRRFASKRDTPKDECPANYGQPRSTRTNNFTLLREGPPCGVRGVASVQASDLTKP